MNALLSSLAGLALASSWAGALTWEDTLREAAGNNPTLLASRQSLEAAGAARSAARSGYYPLLDLNAAQARSETEFANSALNAGPVSAARAGPRAAWNLFNGFATRASVEQAGAGLRQATADLAAAQAEVRGQLRRGFGRLLAAQETIALSEAIAARLKANAAFISLRYEGGVEALWGRLKAEADAQEAQWEADRARLDLRSARKSLSEALGRSVSGDLEAAGELSAAGPGSLEEALEQAPAHPSVRRQEEAVALARARLRSAQSENWPSLDFSANYERRGRSWTLKDRAWSAEGTVSLPLFAGGRVRDGVRQERRLLEAESRLLEAARNAYSERVESAYARYKAAAGRQAVAKAQREAARQRAETVSALYANGKATFLEWDQSQASYTSLQRAELTARLEAYLALADWEEARGVGLP